MRRRLNQEVKARTADLAASEARYCELFAKAPYAFLVVTNEVIAECNEAALELLGLARAQVVGRMSLDFWLTPTQQSADKGSKAGGRRSDEEALHQRKRRFEWLYRRPDGAERRVDVVLTVLPHEGSHTLLALLRDITVEHQAGEQLRLLHRAVENCPLSIVITNTKGIISYVNPYFEKLTGYPSAEAAGQNPRILKSGLQPQEYYGSLWGTILRGQDWIGEFSNVKKDGTRYLEKALISPIRDEQGQITHFVAVMEDITLERSLAESLAQSQARKQLAMDMAQIAYWEYDVDRGCFILNDRFYALLGTTVEREGGVEMSVETYARKFIPGEGAASGLAQELAKAVASTSPTYTQQQEWSMIRADGVEIHVCVRFGIRKNAEGRTVSLFGANQDITDRKLSEKMLQKTLQDLANVNQQLQEASVITQQMAMKAEAASQAKSAFLANMSHEIRTPMNAVIGMTGLLLDTPMNDLQCHYLETVHTSSESLLALINDILDFSKIEAGRMELEVLEFNLFTVLDDVARIEGQRAHKKGLELVCMANPDVPMAVRGDPARLRQVLVNLVENAIKFTKAGEVVVKAELEQLLAEEAVVHFSVKDTGIGIPSEKLAVLFKSFSQVDASHTREYGGTGLGLAISKQLVELMGGEIGVKSEMEVGSEFWFTVRLAVSNMAHSVESVQHWVRGRPILVVDDNAASRMSLLTRLKVWGAQAQAAADGPLALQALYAASLTADPFEVVLLDLEMPGMDGTALARAIKIDVKLAATQLIAMYRPGRNLEQQDQVYFRAFLTKPLQQADLAETLVQVLSNGTVVEEVAKNNPISMPSSGHPFRILLADDSVSNQEVAVGLMKKLGYPRVDVVANGAEALKTLENLPYDLVFMDVQMPEMDGLEATRRIRASHAAVDNQRIPIIAMTAHALAKDREKCLEAGMDDFMTKPIMPSVLRTVLGRWLHKKESKPPMQPVVSAPAVPLDSGAVVLDAETLFKRMMQDRELLHVVVSQFLCETPQYIEMMQTIIGKGDRVEVANHAHLLKGSAANINGDALRQVAYEMEQDAKAGNFVGLRARMPVLREQYRLLSAALEQELKR